MHVCSGTRGEVAISPWILDAWYCYLHTTCWELARQHTSNVFPTPDLCIMEFVFDCRILHSPIPHPYCETMFALNDQELSHHHRE
jgi:hypothetical protein